MYTKHGHHIEGTKLLGMIPEDEVQQCGGPGVCGACTEEAVDQNEEKEVAEEVAFHYAVAIAELFNALDHEITKNYRPSREVSLVRTKLQEAELWLTKCEEENQT